MSISGSFEAYTGLRLFQAGASEVQPRRCGTSGEFRKLGWTVLQMMFRGRRACDLIIASSTSRIGVRSRCRIGGDYLLFIAWCARCRRRLLAGRSSAGKLFIGKGSRSAGAGARAGTECR